LERELVDHWQRNLNSFPEDKLVEDLEGLTREVQEDLRTGPAKTIADLHELQDIVVNRKGLHLDLLVSPSVLDSIRPELAEFVNTLPEDAGALDPTDPPGRTYPIIDKLAEENNLTAKQSPWYLGFVVPQELSGNAIFYSNFVDYSQVDRDSLLRLLASGILAGRGPNSAYMKSREAGLAYALFLKPDPSRGLILYYADRSLDLPSLIASVNSEADAIPKIQDQGLIDYVLRQAYPMYPRSNYTFSVRERLLAQDLRDGNTPEKVRRFYESLLALRNYPNLLSEITQVGKDSLCGILLEQTCTPQQKADHSIFFFVSSENTLSDMEKRLPIKLLRIWPSDYWLQ
jgi:hypothetical protein